VAWCVGVAVGLAVIGIGFSVNLTASDQEPLLAGIGALVALGGLLGCRRGQQQLARLSAVISGVGAFAALVFAAFHWWMFVFVAVVIARMLDDGTVLARDQRSTSRAWRNYLDDIVTSGFSAPLRMRLAANRPIEPRVFDDPDAVTVYADRKKAALAALLSLGGAAALSGILYALSGVSPSPGYALRDALGFLACELLIVLLGALGLIALSQMIRPRPLVAIGSNGLVLRGVSRIRWDEIVAIDIQVAQRGNVRGPSWLARRVLRLRVANPAAVRARQPRWVQMLVDWSILELDFPISLYERLLPISLEAVVALILPHVQHEEEDAYNWSIQGPRDGVDAWLSSVRRPLMRRSSARRRGARRGGQRGGRGQD
jgi:hypothetical protein